jgi:DNA helicase IV
MSNVLDDEQEFTDTAYSLLSAQREHLSTRMTNLALAASTGTGQDDLEREAHADNLRSQLRSVEAAKDRLYFGRINSDTQETHRIGRIGLRTESGDMALIDWRAPNAAPFYQATTAHRMNTVLRRRISIKSIEGKQVVTHVDDEILTEPGEGSYQAAKDSVAAPRDGRMADILDTIATDQDVIIRSPLNQITVVQGGPGTGKSVVALHRAAWLLYTFRDRLAKDAILIVGPSTAFLRYIDQVLPSLGETDIVLLTPGQLFPGINATTDESFEVSGVKGRAKMAQVLANAVAHWSNIPDSQVNITTEGGTKLHITRSQIRDCVKSLSKRSTYHVNREIFLKRVLEYLARNLANDQGHEQIDYETRSELLADFIDDRNVRRVLNLMWMPTTPQKVLTKLFGNRDFLKLVSQDVLSSHEQSLLYRETGGTWTVDDVALLDECAELLGDWVRAVPESRETRSDYMELDAGEMRYGNRDSRSARTSTVAERAYFDREWIYGHIVVDEAQELSEMAWRAIQRRAVRKSMTIVGDLQQSSHPAGARDWNEALAWAGEKLALFSLHVTYRITEETVQTSIEQLLKAGGTAPELVSIRNGAPTVNVSVVESEILVFLKNAMEGHAGRACVVLPDPLLPRWQEKFHDKSNDIGFGPAAIDFRIAVLSAKETKGLEFDVVFVVNPDQIGLQGVRGSDIFVACTRATHQLYLLEVEPD